MMKLLCNATTYMPVEPPKHLKRTRETVLARFEDGDVVEIDDEEAQDWLATGVFKEIDG